METSAQVLFQLMDQELERSAHNIRDRVFSRYKDMPWRSEHREVLQPLIRLELERFVQSILGIFTNVGGVLPDDAPFYMIMAVSEDTSENISSDYTDYSSLWLEYLMTKLQSSADQS